MKILVISRECWRSDSNEGNVLTSLFSGQPFEFANIYCKPGLPDNLVCGRSFQLTDHMALANVLHKTPMGQVVEPEQKGGPDGISHAEKENSVFYDFFRRHNLEIFYSARELLWRMADFTGEPLNEFIRAFQPDLIFASLCYSQYVLRLQRYVIGLCGCPAVTYLYDDLYSLRQFRLSPVFWINRFSLRTAIRKTLPFYRYAYTMTQEQGEEYHRQLGIEMRVLQKAAFHIEDSANSCQPDQPIRFVYAGGVYYGRDQVLIKIAKALSAYGPERCRLDVYTRSPLSGSAKVALNDGTVTFLHDAVTPQALASIYQSSQVALHVESFQLKNKLITRLSFSTKIVDCLASGCAVMAVCPDINAGFRYLLRNDAALCVASIKDLPEAIEKILSQPNLVSDYASRALNCARANHDPYATRAVIRRDFELLKENPSK